MNSVVEVTEWRGVGMEWPEGILHVEGLYQSGQAWGHFNWGKVSTILFVKDTIEVSSNAARILTVEQKLRYGNSRILLSFSFGQGIWSRREIKVGKCDACGRDDSHDFLLNETAVSPESQTAVEPVAVKTVNVKTADVEKVEKGMQTSTFMMDFGYQVNQNHIENKVGKKSEACVLQ